MIETENKNTQEQQDQETKPRKRYFGRKFLAVIFSLIFVFSRGYMGYSNSVSSTITINSIFAADGKNPDGTPFSIMEIFNDDTLTLAVEKLNGKMSVQELRSHLNVSDTRSQSSFSALEQSVLDGEDENTYFPTQYVITYSVISEQIKYEGIVAQCKSLWRSIFVPSKTKILSAVIQSYIEYYSEAHLNYQSLFNIDWDAVDSLDYYNRFDFIQNTVWRLQRFVQYKYNRSLSANKADTGYYDLMTKLLQGPAKNIENFQAYITQHGVTNDKYALLRQFAYMQKIYEEEYARKTQEYNVLKEAIEMYDSTTTKVVFIPALDGENSFYMNRTKVGIDYLSEKADASKIQADSAAYSAKLYIYLQECFSNDYIIDEQGNKKWLKNTQEERTHANELYVALKKELREFSDELQLLVEEGKELQQEEIIASKPRGTVGIVDLGIAMIKEYAILSIAAYVVIYITKAILEKKQMESEEHE